MLQHIFCSGSLVSGVKSLSCPKVSDILCTMNTDFKSTPRTDKLLSDQQFDAVDYDASCLQLSELCAELEQDLNAAMLNVKECELEIKDLTIRAMEAEKKAERYRLDANKEMAKPKSIIGSFKSITNTLHMPTQQAKTKTFRAQVFDC